MYNTIKFPKIELGDDQLHIIVKHNCVTFAVIERLLPVVRTSFTLDRIEAEKALDLLKKLLDSNKDGSTFVEGVYMGGPPEDGELSEL